MSDLNKKNKPYTSIYSDLKKAHISTNSEYNSLYKESIEKPEQFWERQANKLSWIKKWDKVSDCDFYNASISWFKGGKLNVSYNCLDRHIEKGLGKKTALIWEGNDPNLCTKLSYSELLTQVCKFSNVLKSRGIKKGDRVCIYMQMIPELTIAMLACSRIGAIHSIVFGAFSPESLKDRINDSSCKLLITQDTGIRGIKKNIPMKSNADIALKNTPSIESVIVVNRTGNKIKNP